MKYAKAMWAVNGLLRALASAIQALLFLQLLPISTVMNDRARELIAAASAIDPASLQAAIAAIEVNCREYLRWAELFSCRLESVAPSELHKFARALSLTLIGHLPTRPGTCPFCLQYDRDRSCSGCGYAATHGRCDADDSAFSLFIEAFQELGRAIYQDTEVKSVNFCLAGEQLRCCLQDSQDRARWMMKSVKECSVMQLMELKVQYLAEMINLLPLDLLSREVAKISANVKETLKDYW